MLISNFQVACTHGPIERRDMIDQVLQQVNTYRAYIIVQSEEFRRPTGINTFPNGGVNWIINQNAKVYEVQANKRTLKLLAKISPDDANWEGFSVHLIGFDDKSNLLIKMSGCKKGGECNPALRNYRYYRLSLDGTLTPLIQEPINYDLPGKMLARRRNEMNYVRFLSKGDTLKAVFKEGGKYKSLFVIDNNGNLSAIK